MNIDLTPFYRDVEKFNALAGNLDGTMTFHRFENQAKLIVEEAKETFEDGAQGKNHEEIIDGICDVFVTLAGLMQQAALAGYDVKKALKKVCDNNLTKMPIDDIYCDEVITPSTIAKYKDQGIELDILKTAGRVVYINRKTGKVVKPYNYKSVALTDCLPEVLHD